jgi:hypothetical protein
MVTAALLTTLLVGGVSWTEEEADELPQVFTANVMVTSGPRNQRGITRLRITIEQWTSGAARSAMMGALRDGGTDGLVEEMMSHEAGILQINNSLAYTLRVASTWETEEGRHFRVATERPITFFERQRPLRSEDYPFAIAEFVVPSRGRGEGSLLVATRVHFDEQGGLVIESLPTNTGAQRMTAVQQVGR